MALWTVILLALFFVITLVLLSIFLHYYKQAIDCDSQTSFWCYTDWICDGGMMNAVGNMVTKNEMPCHLKGLYGVKDDKCNNIRLPQPCTPNTTPDGTNPALCTDGNLITTPPDDDPFSCFCNMGTNIKVLYVPGTTNQGATSPSTGSPVGANGCGDFKRILTDQGTSICPPVPPPVPPVV